MITADRNFDDLAHRFKRNVYDKLKGQIRLAVLHRDLAENIAGFSRMGSAATQSEPAVNPLRVLDAGGGQGQLSLELARLGHRVDLCDISANMLQLAREQFAEHQQQAGFYHDSIQNHCAQRSGHYDVVLCHAVLEWVAEPQPLLQALYSALKPGGYLSLTFYNIDGIKMKNLLRGNFSKILKDDYRGYRGSLTPTWPRNLVEVYSWLEPFAMEQLCHSGIRCFHDYILDPEHRALNPQDQLALELRFSRQEPFRSLGRYIHLLFCKP